MDAQVLQELVLIRWLLTVLAIAATIFALGYVLFFGAGYMQQLKKAKAEDTFSRGNGLLNKGKLEDLLRLCDEHLLDFPADAGIYWLKGTAHYRRKEWNQALICYRKADELQPGFAIGPPIAEIEEKIGNAGTSPALRVVANEDSNKGVDA